MLILKMIVLEDYTTDLSKSKTVGKLHFSSFLLLENNSISTFSRFRNSNYYTFSILGSDI